MVDFSRLPLYLGAVTVSPAAMAALAATEETVLTLLVRHAAGDWGAVDDDERAANWTALVGDAGLVCSAYPLAAATVMVATEMTPRQTSIILAEEIR